MAADSGFELGNDGPLLILAGVDGSPSSLRAGAYAIGVARRQKAALVAVYVATSPSMAGLVPSAASAVEETLAQSINEVREQIESAAAHIGVPVTFRAERGDPFSELSRVASELRADQVIVGASTRTGHRIIGSLAVRLVKAANWPVTVVP